MALPFPTRCLLKMLADTDSTDARSAHASVVRALVSGDASDVSAAAAAIRNAAPPRARPAVPTRCDPASFHAVHEAARDSAAGAFALHGQPVPFAQSSEVDDPRFANDHRATRLCFSLVVVVMAVVFAHIVYQRCLPRCR